MGRGIALPVSQLGSLGSVVRSPGDSRGLGYRRALARLAENEFGSVDDFKRHRTGPKRVAFSGNTVTTPVIYSNKLLI